MQHIDFWINSGDIRHGGTGFGPRARRRVDFEQQGDTSGFEQRRGTTELFVQSVDRRILLGTLRRYEIRQQAQRIQVFQSSPAPFFPAAASNYQLFYNKGPFSFRVVQRRPLAFPGEQVGTSAQGLHDPTPSIVQAQTPMKKPDMIR
jgi:hypothetical protein